MSGYQRFIPRDGTRARRRCPAEVAEAAEVEAIQGLGAAEASLKPAEVRSGAQQLQQPSAELQQPQHSGILELQQVQQLQQAPAPKIAKTPDSDAEPSRPEPDDGAARPGIPTEWCEGVLRLSIMPPPRNYPQHVWTQLIRDAERFLDGWAGQAAAIGWGTWELFGAHRRAPWHRLDAMGLVLALQGRELAALTDTEAVIRTARGAHLTHRRKLRDPLHPAERCVVWELA